MLASKRKKPFIWCPGEEMIEKRENVILMRGFWLKNQVEGRFVSIHSSTLNFQSSRKEMPFFLWSLKTTFLCCPRNLVSERSLLLMVFPPFSCVCEFCVLPFVFATRGRKTKSLIELWTLLKRWETLHPFCREITVHSPLIREVK